jgi:hypothetical protein
MLSVILVIGLPEFTLSSDLGNSMTVMSVIQQTCFYAVIVKNNAEIGELDSLTALWL